MRHSVSPGEIWWAAVPYKDDPEQTKWRPVVVVAVSPHGRDEDGVIVVAPIPGFHGDGKPRNGDIAVLNWRQISGLSDGDGSWVHARRLWSTEFAAFDQNKGCVGELPKEVMSQVYTEIIGLFG